MTRRYTSCSEPTGAFPGDLMFKGGGIYGLGGAVTRWRGSREGYQLLELSRSPDLVLPFQISGDSPHGGSRDSVGPRLPSDTPLLTAVRQSEEVWNERRKMVSISSFRRKTRCKTHSIGVVDRMSDLCRWYLMNLHNFNYYYVYLFII